ncbi:MAG: NAD(P)-dependent alcohol dehydrogenase [Rhodospirillales bacterium]|nr:NAD(P)-dependent alcohol dehydrogenase [Rhodospirillales bacterium]
MEVWQLTGGFGIDHLQRLTRPDPTPGTRDVLLEMKAASLNYRDILAVNGGYAPRAQPPLIPVSDGVGVVVAVGDAVTRVRVGDRVCPMFFQDWIGGEARQAKMFTSLGGPVDGTLAQFMCLGEQGVTIVPEHLSDEEAATLPCAALTAWSALATQGEVGPSDTVLVQGTGGVALFALQFARLMGARVIITSSRDDKLARARQLGADEAINYRTTPDWDRVVKDLTGGEGCDHVIELGGADTLARSIRAARIGGRISVIGVLSGAKAEVALPLVVMRNLRLQGVTVGSRDGFEAMGRAIARHRLHPVLDRVFPFDDAPSAFRHLAAARHFGKVCIRHHP